MDFKTLEDFDLKGKTVLLRADLNVPAEDGRVTDTTRIDRLKPTIDFLQERGAKTMIISHFGRPKGERKEEFSLSFLSPYLETQWGINVAFANDCIGTAAAEAAEGLSEGGFVLLENLRFHKGEEANDSEFARQLSAHADIYINDAFSCAHRAHASTEAITHILPSGTGFLMAAELNALADALEKPERPVFAIVGGAKISTKLSVLNNMIEKVDYLCLGGGMANTFLYAQGAALGKSLYEKDMAEEARAIMKKAREKGCEIILPLDHIIVEELVSNAEYKEVNERNVPDTKLSVDCGSRSISHIKDTLANCHTVLWNGPLGVFEIKPFDNGTNEVAKEVARLTKEGKLVSVAGGGDTVSALNNAGVADEFSYISTAGGAFLEWLEGKTLPGVAALLQSKDAA